MKTFFGVILLIALFLAVLVIGFFILASFISAIAVIVKYKPKSYAQFKQAMKTDNEIIMKSRKALQEYESRLLAICEQPLINDADTRQLVDYISQNDLTERQIQGFSHKAFKKHYSVIMEDNLLTESELASVNHLLDFLKPKHALIQKELSEIAKHTTLREISVGVLPTVATSIVALKREEIAHFVVGASLREERVISRGYQGGSHGVSIRIAKGVTYRVGQNRGKMVSETGIVDVDSGSFIITNQRLIFVGNKKSFSYDYKKLLAWNVYSDGISLNFDNAASRNLAFSDDVDADILYFLLAYLVEQSR